MDGKSGGTATTISIPTRLIVECRRSPVRIAFYGLIGRLFINTLTEVPLTRCDLTAYDPTFLGGAFLRAVDKLQKYGWLVENNSHVDTRKNTFIPTWGSVSTSTLMWSQGTELLTCPDHIASVKVDVMIFDHFGGVLIPSRTNPAHVTHNNPDQALRLHDIGTYIAALAQIPGSTERLEAVGLMKDGKPQALSALAP